MFLWSLALSQTLLFQGLLGISGWRSGTECLFEVTHASEMLLQKSYFSFNASYEGTITYIFEVKIWFK